MKLVMRVWAAVMLCVAAVCFTACIGSAPVTGMKSPIVASWKAPLNLDLKDATLGTKVGRATVKSYAFGLVAIGDMSIQTAATNGGIKTIRHVDYEYDNAFFFAYQEMTVIVYGD